MKEKIKRLIVNAVGYGMYALLVLSFWTTVIILWVNLTMNMIFTLKFLFGLVLIGGFLFLLVHNTIAAKFLIQEFVARIKRKD